MYHLVYVLALITAANGASLFDVKPHIIGGKEAKIEDHPYMVSLQETVRGVTKHICGGAILSSKHILTGAHCFNPPTSLLKNFKVQIGSTLISNGKLYGLAKYVLHPKYDRSDPHNDVAVLTLDTPIQFGPNARPVELVPVNQDTQANEVVTASGWGDVTNGTGVVKTLHSVNLPIMGRSRCVGLHLCTFDCGWCRRMAVDEGFICAGGSGSNIRGFDLGGPLVNNKNQLVGVTAYIHNCHPINYPSIAVNVANQRVHDFITANMK